MLFQAEEKIGWYFGIFDFSYNFYPRNAMLLTEASIPICRGDKCATDNFWRGGGIVIYLTVSFITQKNANFVHKLKY